MKRLLLVDDDIDILLMLKRKLSMSGYDVITSTTCKEGLDIFYDHRPDLVLLDINVGTEDGRDMCRTIKQQAEHQHIPVILFSANHELLKLAAEYGANAVIDKPFEISRLVETIRSVLP